MISNAHVVESMGPGWTRSLQSVEGFDVVVDVRPKTSADQADVALYIGASDVKPYPHDIGADVLGRASELLPRLAGMVATLRIDTAMAIGPRDATDAYARALRAHLAQPRFQASAVAAYLATLPRTSASPVLVTIGRTTYAGATFDQVRDHSPGTRAYADGAREYVHSGIYLLGELPPSRLNGSARAYVDSADDDARWFVGSWWSSDDARMPDSDQDLRARGRDSHPLGSMFMMTRDDHGVTLTGVHGQPVKDRTMPMSVETIS